MPFFAHAVNNVGILRITKRRDLSRGNHILDAASFAWTFTFFVYGFLLATHAAVWGTIEQLRCMTLRIALGSFLLLAVVWTSDYEMSQLELVAYRFLKSLHAWCWILALLGFARKYLNRNSSALRYANEAVYPFYILHQTITVVLGYYLASWQVNPFGKFLVIAGGTIAGCWILYEGVVKRSALTRLVFGMKPEKPRETPAGARVDVLVEPEMVRRLS